MLGGLIEKEELTALLPHRGKMFLLSRVVEYDTGKRNLVAEYDVTQDCLFYDPVLGGVPAWVSFEFMAQSISAMSGLAGKENGRSPTSGFVLSLSGMEVKQPVFRIGNTVRICVRQDGCLGTVYAFNGIASIAGENAGQEAVCAKLTVMDAEDAGLFQRQNHGN